MQRKNINEKKEFVCYLIETKSRKYLKSTEKKEVDEQLKKLESQEDFISAKELSKEEFEEYKKNNFERLGKKI